MAEGLYSSDIGLFDSLCFFFFDLLYFLSLGLFDCRFILNLAKFFIVLLYVSSNGFGKTKTLAQLNRLEKIIDKSTAEGGDGSYQFQSLLVLHLMVMEFSTKFYGMVISLTLLFSIEQYKELSRLGDSYWSIKNGVAIVPNSV